MSIKLSFRPNLRLDGTLPSILSIKLSDPGPCQDFEPLKEVLDSSSAKTATMTYNRAQSSKN